MKSMSCSVPGTVVGLGASALCFAFQWIFAIIDPSGKGWPLSDAGSVGGHHHGIGNDHLDQVSSLTDGNRRPVFVSPEFGERETVWYLDRVLVLRRYGPVANDGEHDCKDTARSGEGRQNTA